MIVFGNALGIRESLCGRRPDLLGRSNPKLTPARILVLFVTLGVVLTAVGLYGPLVDFAGAGATVPLTGFGYTMAKGVVKAIQEQGILGILTGGVTAAAAGIAAAVFFGYLAALISKPSDKG